MSDGLNIHISDYKRRSDLDKFIAGFRELCKQTGMHNIVWGGFKIAPVIVTLKFDDGESIGVNRLFKEIGFDYPNT